MSPTSVKEKIQKIEGELELLKRSIIREPDFEVDEENWNKLRPDVKRVRKEQYRKTY